MSEPEAPAPIDPPPALLSALRKILRPIVRMLIRQGVSFPYFSNFMKSLYVEVAAAELPATGGKPATLSRLSLLTGIHRREVKRLREEPAFEDQPLPSAISLGAQVIARWTGEEPWVGDDGHARPLPRNAAADGSSGPPSFDGLVRSVSVDIHPRSVLDEWLRLGVAEIDEQERVRLRTDAFVPSRGYEEKAHFVGRNVRDHIAAAFANLGAEESPFLERSVHYGEVPESAVAELQALAREVGQEALVRVNERARAAVAQATEGDPRRRVNFGLYFYEEEPEDDDSDSSAGAE